MIETTATIVGREDANVVLRLDETGCGRCHEEGGCGGQNISKMFCSSPKTFRIVDPGDVSVGERVTLVIAEGAIRRSAVLAYIMPLLAIFIGAILGSLLAANNGAIAGALAGVVCAWLLLRSMRSKVDTDRNLSLYIKSRSQNSQHNPK